MLPSFSFLPKSSISSPIARLSSECRDVEQGDQRGISDTQCISEQTTGALQNVAVVISIRDRNQDLKEYPREYRS